MATNSLSTLLNHSLWIGGGVVVVVLSIAISAYFLLKRNSIKPTSQKDANLDPAKQTADVYHPTRQQANLLTEGCIYVAYGYLDKAALSFRKYVDEIDTHDKKTLRSLVDIYLRLKLLDDCALMLERLYLLNDEPEFIIASLKQALTIERHHPQLLQVAEHFSPQRKQPEPPPPPPEIPAVASSQEQVSPSEPKTAPKPIPEATASGQPLLVQGNAPLMPLTVGEQFILHAFNPELEARIHIATNNLNAAIPALRYALEVNPQRSVTYFSNLLRIFHAQKSLDNYAHLLWDLYYTLGERGNSLRERFLTMGFSLGTHPVLEALSHSRETWELKAIGQRFGYFLNEENTAPRLNLVEEISETSTSLIQTSDVLQEVDGYLEFGQIEEAIATLEKAILTESTAVNLYPPLFNLYDRLDDLERFTKWAAELKKSVPQLPPEITPMMTNLYRRLYQRKKKIAA